MVLNVIFVGIRLLCESENLRRVPIRINEFKSDFAVLGYELAGGENLPLRLMAAGWLTVVLRGVLFALVHLLLCSLIGFLSVRLVEVAKNNMDSDAVLDDKVRSPLHVRGRLFLWRNPPKRLPLDYLSHRCL